MMQIFHSLMTIAWAVGVFLSAYEGDMEKALIFLIIMGIHQILGNQERSK